MSHEGSPLGFSSIVNRRRLMRIGSDLSLGAGVLFVGAKLLEYVPPGSSESVEVGKHKFSPGWIERNIKAPFLYGDKGHRDFLLEGIFNNPLVEGVTRDAVAYLLNMQRKGQRATLGQIAAYTFERASVALSQEDQAIGGEAGESLCRKSREMKDIKA